MFKKLFGIKEDWVVFVDGLSKNGNGDSIKPLAEELRRRRPDMKFFFYSKAKKKSKLNHIDMADEILLGKSLRCKYVCSKAKYIVSNMNFPDKGKKRKGQVFISTWHGTPLKKLYLSKDNKNKKFIKYVKPFELADCFCIQGAGLQDETKEAFNLNDNQLLKSGLPRNDILFKNNEDFKSKLKQDLNLPFDKKIILYCPTWRKSDYNFKAVFPLDLEKLNELQNEYVFLIRSHTGRHTWVDSTRKPLNLFDDKFFFDGANYPEVTHLYAISDVLVTDYSSAMFDFAITNKPQIFYAYDLENYSKEVGLYKDYKEMIPGEFTYDTDTLINAIKNLDKFYEIYGEKYQEFQKLYLEYEKGNSAKIVIDKLLELGRD